MPTMANITVKKADGTTDVVYTGVSGSSGDRTPAIWQNQTVGTMPAERPTLSVVAKATQTGTGRRIDYDFVWPLTSQDAGGNKSITNQPFRFRGDMIVPQVQASTQIAEQVHQSCNLLAAALFKAMGIEGYAAR